MPRGKTIHSRDAQARIHQLEAELEETRILLEQERLQRIQRCQRVWSLWAREHQDTLEPSPLAALFHSPDGKSGGWGETTENHGVSYVPGCCLKYAGMHRHYCRDAVLEAIGLAAEQFLRNADLRWNIQTLLNLLGWATRVSRVYVFENTLGDDGVLMMNQRYEWTARGITPQIQNPTLQQLPYITGGFARWQKMLSRGVPIYGEIESFPPDEQCILKPQDILSVVVVPIFVGTNWWGFLGFDDCVSERRWSDSEIDTLRIAAGLAGAAIQRHEMLVVLRENELSLRRSRDQLEEWVAERTADLKAANQALQREIAERQRAEEQLHFQAHLLDAVGQAVIAARLDGTIVYWNHAAETLYGWTSDEAIGQHICRLSHEAHHPTGDPHTCFSGGASWSGEMLARHRDGSVFPVFATDAPITDEEGNLNGIIRVATDITARKRAEQVLAEREAHYRTLVETLPGAILLTDQYGVIQFCNQQTARLFGYNNGDELYGQQWTTLAPYVTPEPDTPGLPQNPVPFGAIRNKEYLLRRKDGSQFAGEVSSSVVTNPQGEPLSLIIVVQDISERKKLQTMVIENERFAASGRLAASIAHEINTPLQSLDFSLEMAQIGPPQERTLFLEDARQEIQRIARIVRQLLDLHRPMQARYGPIHINELLERALLVMGKWIRDHKIAVRLDLTEPLPALPGYADELMQVFINLLMNAVYAMPVGGILEIRTMSRNDAVLVAEIADTGTGIPPDFIERIFEPFVTTKDDGTGLGLSISRQIIERHGGSIEVRSMVNVGSTFTIVLPISPPPGEREKMRDRNERRSEIRTNGLRTMIAYEKHSTNQ